MSMLPHSLGGQEALIPSNMICMNGRCGMPFRVEKPKKGAPCPYCGGKKTEPKKTA